MNVMSIAKAVLGGQVEVPVRSDCTLTAGVRGGLASSDGAPFLRVGLSYRIGADPGRKELTAPLSDAAHRSARAVVCCRGKTSFCTRQLEVSATYTSLSDGHAS